MYYRWSIAGSAEERLTDSTLREYVVQYNESDLDFVSRLLEEEGVSYCFEHRVEATILCLTDRPGAATPNEGLPAYRLTGQAHGMSTSREQVIRSFRDARRLRSRAVAMRDYDWPRSALTLEARLPGGASQDLEHFEFPARDEVVARNPGEHPSRVRLERFGVEQSLSEGHATVRALQPGQRFMMLDEGGSAMGEHLVVRVETVATQQHFEGTALDDEPFGFDGRSPRTPHAFANRFAAVRASLPFRPPMITRPPRIHGVQTAIITDEKGGTTAPPEINTDGWARVRVRFPWDQRDDGQPSSPWIRVSQYWAGAGFGALYTPRVGQEVLVAFLQGDPERPIIIGRVYNQTNPPPFSQSEMLQNPARSTVRSRSTPNATGSNEIRFDDRAGHEEIYLHAQCHLREVVNGCHSTSVGGDQSNTVCGKQTITVKGEYQHTKVEHDQINDVGQNRTHTVELEETITVKGDRTVNMHANENRNIGAKRTTEIAGDDVLIVRGARETDVVHDDERNVNGSSRETIDGNNTRRVKGSEAVTIDGSRGRTVGGSDVETIRGESQVDVSGARTVKAAGCTIEMQAGFVRISNGAGASIVLLGGEVFVSSDSNMLLNASGDLTAQGAMIKLNP